MQQSKFSKLVQVALLIAIQVVLSRFCSIQTPVLKIGLGFVPIALCAVLYGPLWAALAGGLADFIGAVLFPIGAYFPGFTLSAALAGVVFGLFLYHREVKGWHLWAAVAVHCLGISLLLNTLWLSMLNGVPFYVNLLPRILQNCLMVPVQLVILRLLSRPFSLCAAQFGRAAA